MIKSRLEKARHRVVHTHTHAQDNSPWVGAAHCRSFPVHPGRVPLSLAYSLERRRVGKGKPLIQRNQESHDGSLLSREFGRPL